MALNSFQHLNLMGCHNDSLSFDATIAISKNCPNIGENVVIIFVT